MIWEKLTDAMKRLDALDDRIQEWVRDRAGVDEERLQSTISNASGESINQESLTRQIDTKTVSFNTLDEGEQPHYLLNGPTIDVEGQGAGSESIIGWDRDRRFGAVYTIITEKRVLIIANHARGYDEHTIPYDSITAVNLNDGLMSTSLSIQTKSATYHCSISKTRRMYGKDEEKHAIEYLRERRRQEDNPDSTEDSLDRLEKLKSLYDDGAITEEEFKEKKEELLDDI